MKESEWTYKGHQCWVELEYEEDNMKAHHFVITPGGALMFANVSPYDRSRRSVEAWIDAGYPTGHKKAALEDFDS